MAMPMPEQFQQFESHLPPQYSDGCAEQNDTVYYNHWATPRQYDPMDIAHAHYAPPIPPKVPIYNTFPPSPPSSESSPVGPDPLPPHSQSQSLTSTQRDAFNGPPVAPPVHLGKDEIYSSSTGLALYVVAREAKHMPSFMSSKPLLTIQRTSDNTTMGTLRFHSLTSSAVEVECNGKPTRIESDGLFSARWRFASTICQGSRFWKKNKSTGGYKLKDSKKRVLATVEGDLLCFETTRIEDHEMDENVLTAFAVAEARRRRTNADSLGNPVSLPNSLTTFTDG